MQQIGKRENKQRKDEIMAKLQRQKETSEKMYRDFGVRKVELGSDKFEKARL